MRHTFRLATITLILSWVTLITPTNTSAQSSAIIERPKISLVFPSDLQVGNQQSIQIKIDDVARFSVKPAQLKEVNDGYTYEFEYPSPLRDGEQYRWVLVKIDFGKDSQYHTYRSFVSITRDNEVIHRVDLKKATPVSFAVKPHNFPTAVNLYAGDTVSLTVGEIGNTLSNFYWYAFSVAGQVEAEDIVSDVDLPFELIMKEMTHIRMRKEVRTHLEKVDNQSRSLAAESQAHQATTFLLGKGQTVSWQPNREGTVLIVLAAQNSAGVWASVGRRFQVLDMRPTVWLQPAGLTGVFTGNEDLRLEAELYTDSVRPGTEHLLYSLFKNFRYLASAGSPIGFSMEQASLNAASFPLKDLIVDFGDGTKQTIQADSKLPKHTYKAPGAYEINITFRDVHNLFRKQKLIVEVLPATTPPPEALPLDLPTENDSFHLFRKVLSKFADRVSVLALASTAKHVGIVPVMTEDYQRWPPSGDTVDLVDSYLVNALLDKNIRVTEYDDAFNDVLPYHYGNGTQPNATIAYKLKRASVSQRHLHVLIQRTARILAVVRIHDQNGSIILNELVEVTESDLIKRTDKFIPGPHFGARDAYPENFLNTVPEVVDITEPDSKDQQRESPKSRSGKSKSIFRK